MTHTPSELEFYAGLMALDETLFPKKCGNCGRQFETFSEFVEATEQVGNSSGLTPLPVSMGRERIGIFRNCVCGSTLLVPCASRRGDSPEAVKRRELFGKLMDNLELRGWSRSAARQQLVMFMDGERVEFHSVTPPRPSS